MDEQFIGFMNEQFIGFLVFGIVLLIFFMLGQFIYMATSDPVNLFNALFRMFFWVYSFIYIIALLVRGIDLPTQVGIGESIFAAVYFIGQVFYMATSNPCNAFNAFYRVCFWVINALSFVVILVVLTQIQI